MAQAQGKAHPSLMVVGTGSVILCLYKQFFSIEFYVANGELL
jgi:hypothetical protein